MGGPETPTDEETFARTSGLTEFDGVAVKVSEMTHMSKTTSRARTCTTASGGTSTRLGANASSEDPIFRM
nr:hypothetical protein [Halocatena marina]